VSFALLAFLAAGAVLPSFAEDPPPRSASGTASGASQAVPALHRGLEYLADLVLRTEDGAIPCEDAKQYAPVGVTALAALAFLGEGTAEARGQYSRAAERAIEYLVRKSELSVGKDEGYIRTDGDNLSRMHGHGYATLALAEAYGMFGPRLGRDGVARLERALVAAVRRIEKAQGSRGGWYYDPHPTWEHEGSVTVCAVQALRAARNAGIAVPREVVDKALEYLRLLQKEDGSFRYQIGSERSTVALTAASVATLQAMGDYDGEVTQRGLACLLREIEARYVPFRTDAFPYYERFYLAQALYQHRDPAVFERWFAREQRQILDAQSTDGSWRDPQCPFGTPYTTAMNCLVLEVPLGVLPIFQR
jgi:hypothetical protein